MNICVCGWYFFDGFMKALKMTKFKVDIIAHRDPPDGIECRVIPNTGLEWGVYDYYTKNVWDHNSNVLFCHDDINVDDPDVFIDIARLQYKNLDCAFIFNNRADELESTGSAPHGRHGRGMFIKQWLLNRLGGFWFDENNLGTIKDPVPDGMHHVNMGMMIFWDRLQEISLAKTGAAYFNGWHNAYRGKIR